MTPTLRAYALERYPGELHPDALSAEIVLYLKGQGEEALNTALAATNDCTELNPEDPRPCGKCNGCISRWNALLTVAEVEEFPEHWYRIAPPWR